MSAQRDVRVRVRSQYAALYPELATGVWVSAREFAQVIVARASQARRESLHRRTLDLRHFEVRGVRDPASPDLANAANPTQLVSSATTAGFQ
jgi:hypothetical protein